MRNRRNGAHTERASEAMNGQDSGGEQDYGDKRVERGGASRIVREGAIEYNAKKGSFLFTFSGREHAQHIRAQHDWTATS